MNAFIPQNPTVVLLVSSTGAVLRSCNNVDPDLKVLVTTDFIEFEWSIKGVPFDSARPPGPSQVLAAKKG